ncbi:hypothetical protein [Alkalibacillus haloalkaliphilus]|uniref:hypothetical protein n=1 Tax=Alkalibacillus haloalkaliphilus TaxID=94136 RepID=UPI00037FE083|nr:hypothetical protein [Alkalibacillus haloalkaliphilus]
MEITYSNKKLEKILTSERQIKKKYTKFYSKVILRMSELRAANNLGDISPSPPPRRHKLTSQNHCWGVDVSKNFRLIIQAREPFDPNNLNTVTRISILSIEDYH